MGQVRYATRWREELTAPMSQPWKAGFEIELLAPRSQSRANLALRVAWL